MKNFTVLTLLIAVVFLAFVSCKGNQNKIKSTDNNKENSTACEVKAKVVDFTGLDGCSILLELSDGSYLDPIDGFPRQEILEAQTVKISYTKALDAASFCMKGQLVNITCFKVIEKGTPTKGEIH